MKGKMKPSTRYERFRNDVLNKFNNRYSNSAFISFLAAKTYIDHDIRIYCDDNDMLLDDLVCKPNSLWQVFRLIKEPILLRDLEVYGSVTYNDFNSTALRNSFYTAISLLYSINLIDYTIRDFDGRPSDTIQFFIKEDELTTNVEE